jgi:hypothetical protein
VHKIKLSPEFLKIVFNGYFDFVAKFLLFKSSNSSGNDKILIIIEIIGLISAVYSL